MSDRTSWGNAPQTIIYRKMGAIWTWDEYRADCQQELEMIASVQHSIVLIIDATKSLTLPNGALAHFKHTLETCPEQCEKQILVSSNYSYWTMHRLLLQMLPQMKGRFFIVRSLEEAYQLAEQSTHKPLSL